MITTGFLYHNRKLALRARLMFRFEQSSLAIFAQATALALPLSFLALDGMLFAVGAVYAIGYALIMLPPTALHVLILLDASRVLVGKVALFVPFFEALGKVADKRPAREPTIAPLLRLGVVGNPLGVLTREMWLLAFRFRPNAMKQIKANAERIATQMGESGMTGRLVAEEVRSMPRHASELDLVMC